MNEINKNTILVTGAAGLIGSEVIRKFSDLNVNIIGLDCCNATYPPEKASWINIDLTDDRLESELTKYTINTLIHCAAHPGGKSLQEPSLDVEVNVHSSMRLFEICAKHNIEVIYLSSSVIYGDAPKGPIKENAPLAPGTIYGVCKVACENFLRILQDGYGLRWTVLRLFATYGAGHKPSLDQGIVNIMLTQLQSSDRVVVKGSLERSRDMVFVEDAADAIVKCVYSRRSRGHIINIGTDNPITIRSLIENIAKVLGKSPSNLKIVEEQGTVGDPFYNSANIDLAKDLLEYNPKYDLESGLAELLIRRNVK